MGRTTAMDIATHSESPGPAPRAALLERRGARMALWGVISVLFTLLILQYSFVRGRLLLPASYDDVTYLLDGLNRLEIWYAGGLWALVLSWLHHPPHSPFSTVLAIAGFALFGMHDWSPYAWNAVIVFVLLAFFDSLLGRLRLRWKIAAAIVALCTPIVGQSVAEFRPDIFAGLLSAILVVMLLDDQLIGRSPRRLLGAGVIWGLCLWAKPSVFPVTLGLGGLAMGLATLRDIWLIRPERFRWTDIASTWIAVVAPAVILALPHYLLDGRYIVHYIWINEAGPRRQMWQLHADFKTHLLYYSVGEGGLAMLRVYFWIFLAVMVGGIGLLISDRDRRMWATIGCGVIVGIAAYTVPTINPQKQSFLATPFDFLMLFGAILVIRELSAERLPPLVGLFGALMTAMLVVVSVLYSGFPGAPGWDRTSADVRTTRQTVAGVYAAIRDRYETGQKYVWLNVTGPLNTDLLQYTAMKDGIVLTFTGKADTRDLALYQKGYDICDFVVAADPGVPDLPANLPSNSMLDQTLALIRARPDFELLATVPVGDGLNYYVFHKLGRFHGWTQVVGLAPLEGPYPQWGLGQVRWGLGPATTITLDADSAHDMEFSARAQSQLADQKMTILLDGRKMAEHAFTVPGNFDMVIVPMHLAPGRHVLTLQYATWVTDPARQAAVLYTALQIDPTSK
jgi:Dolichyl-phosphate-mannose-protein mannosyltransferase